MSKGWLAAVLLVVPVLSSGCGAASGAVDNATSTGPPQVSVTQPSGCPQLEPKPGQGTAVDFVDFIQANGHTYLVPESMGLPPVAVSSSDLGDVQFSVACALGPLNERTLVAPPAPRDGDSAFVPEGSPVYAVKGWDPACRLAAQHSGSWHVYLAMEVQSTTAKARACALSPGG